MHYVLEHLAIGNAADAREGLNRFDAFLNVAREIETPPGTFAHHPYLKIPLDDMKPLPPFCLLEAAAFIDRHIGNHRILVYCDGGVGRAPSVVVAYLCSKGMRFGQAVEFVAVRKPYMSILPELIDSVRKAFSRPPTPILPLDQFSLPSKAAQPENIPRV